MGPYRKFASPFNETHLGIGNPDSDPLSNAEAKRLIKKNAKIINLIINKIFTDKVSQLTNHLHSLKRQFDHVIELYTLRDAARIQFLMA